jgi:uncharacterized protein YbjT (DUF2867 family)
MNVLLFGATGMIGQGVLRECLLDDRVTHVLTVGRSSTGQRHAKLREIVQADLDELSPIESELTGFDACFYCLGVSAAGMSERDYVRITYDLTLSVANALIPRNPQMIFIYVSGAGADSTERGGTMWARVKGRTENALLCLQFKGIYIFRPALVLPMHGIKSRTAWYRVLYALLRPVYPLLKLLSPRFVTTTVQIGRAMLRVAASGFPRNVMESRDIDGL